MNKYLVIGLGNAGDAYAHTRHNIGFDAIDFFAQKYNAIWSVNRLAFTAEVKLKGKQILLIKPTTFMNLSGKAVKFWIDKESIPIEHILVIVDDLALPLEKFRVRGEGSDAGHNGLKDIQQALLTTKYPRLRFGIGNAFAKGQQADFVLDKWKKEELLLVQKKIELTAVIVEKFILEGLHNTMNFCNHLKVEI